MDELDKAFCLEAIKEIDWYRMCNNHVKQRDGFTKIPMKRFDLRDALFKLDLPENAALDERIQMHIYDEWDDIANNFKHEYGFEIFFDINGYRLLAGIKELYNALENIQELENETDLKEYDKEELEWAYNDLMQGSKEWMIFCKWFEGFKKGWEENFKERVVVIDDEGNLDFVYKDWYYDMKEENGWKIWTEQEEFIKNTNPIIEEKNNV